MNIDSVKLSPPERDVVHSVVTDGANDEASLKKDELKGRRWIELSYLGVWEI